MKQGRPVIVLVMIAMAAALAVYFGVYAFQIFNTPYSTTFAYAYTVSDSAAADGLLVRQEQVLTAKEGIRDVIRGEGEKVGVGQTVALVYRDSQAQADQAELEELETNIQLLEHAVTQAADVDSAARLDEDILQAMVSLRASAAQGDFGDLQEQVLEVKSSVLKRGYTYGDGVTAADLSARLRELKAGREALSRQTSAATTRVTVKQAGTFSNQVDGYESLLTPEQARSLTPAALERLMDEPPASDREALGKLILGSRWYFVTNLPVETAQRLSSETPARLRFTGEFDQEVDMAVEHISQAEGERVTVVFSTDRYLGQTTLLRRQTAELVFEDFTGLRVPKEAVRMVKVESTDEQTGEVTVTSRLGVYALVSGRAEFKRVEVVTEGGDYYVVKPADSGRKILRAGDEVITRATGLYDGQLLEF